MDLTVLLGSLAAVLALAAIAWALKLGASPRIANEEEAARLAREAHSGFRPSETALDAEGRAALVMGERGEIVLLRPHGAQVAARVFRAPPRTERTGGELKIATGERMFGDVTLMLGEREAEDWARRLEGRDA